MSNDIRIGYSGFISFVSRILSLFTGLVFITLITRNLSQHDFGLWQFILSIVTYSVLPNAIVDYWVLRDLARGERHATTAVVFSMLLSLGGIAVYMIISLLSAPRVHSVSFFFVIAIAQVPLSYLSITLQTISQASKPQSVGIAFIIFEITKIIIAVFALFRFGVTLNVAITAVLGALVAQCITLIITQPPQIYSRTFDRQVIKKWLRTAWLPAFITFVGYLATFDGLVVTIITSSTLALANFRAANVISALVSHAGAFTFALYPKLIGEVGRERKDVSKNYSIYITKLIVLFSVPMATGLFILCVPLLSLLGHSYANAYLVLWLGIPFMVIGSIHQVFDTILTAGEKVDLTKSYSFKKYVKSRLFTVPEITLFGDIIGISVLGIISYWFTLKHASPITIAVVWSVIALAVSSPGLIIKWRMMQRSDSAFKFPWKNITLYSGASTAMALILITTGAYNFSYKSMLELIVRIIGYALIGTVVYSAIVFTLDREFRMLTYKFIKIIKSTRFPL